MRRIRGNHLKALHSAAMLLAFLTVIVASRISASAESSQYNLYGEAKKTGEESFRLTTAEVWKHGGIYFNEAISLDKGMTAEFEYRVTGGEASNLGYADGFAFVMSPKYSLGGEGETLGFPEGEGAYGVEFDSYYNDSRGDPEGAHAGILYNNAGNHLAYAETPLVISNSWTKARVEYKNNTISLYIGGTKYVSSKAPHMPDEIFAGFTASTGDGFACHEVRKIKIEGKGTSEKKIVTTGEKFTVNFDPDGGEVSEWNRECLNGQKVGKLPKPSKKGYKFVGWYYKSGKKSVKATGSTKVTKNISLKAKWKLKSSRTYTITINPNGGKGGIRKLTKYKNVPLVLEGRIPECKGYFFRGWSTSKKGNLKYRYREEYTANRSVTLYAKWEKFPKKTITKTSGKGTAKSVAAKKNAAYPELSTMMSDGTIKIPGLDTCCVSAEGKRDVCDAMVPQGICVGYYDNTRYILISAYCYDQLHNSVLHVIRRDDRKYIGTVTLDHPKGKTSVGGWDHNGGITCDDSGNIWIANSTTGKVSVVSMEKVIKAAVLGSKNKAPLVKYDGTFNCIATSGRNIESASFMTWSSGYDGGTLWVGYCKEKNDKNVHAALYGFRVNYNGSKPSSIKLKQSWPLPMHANGAAFIYDDYLVVSSQSGSRSDSYLYGYIVRDTGKSCVFEKKGKIKLPPMLEELCVSDGYLYSIYESGAKPYQKKIQKNSKKGTVMNEICIGNSYDIYNILNR